MCNSWRSTFGFEKVAKACKEKILNLVDEMEEKVNKDNTINDTIKPKPEYTLDVEK